MPRDDYRFVYSTAGQSQELAHHLPERRRKRRPRFAGKPRSPVFPETSRIDHRPEAVNARQEFGHWEADLMILRKQHRPANVATVVERKSRFTLLFRNKDRRSKPLMGKLIDLLSPLPQATAGPRVSLGECCNVKAEELHLRLVQGPGRSSER
ncbi:IS30 family transposase [Rubellimicrobium rubrum]|uniref:IS30 family transposase n=1 Tax=Rubellimicrobium rubrum TaxID=2585369 RepID=A0A5C4MX89_9RHOB|nr:IS30 family transposase [Rubellimicrobium rubrum]TNC48715.1 IS30 family transposase [Rubellimicrobium rubrum]